MSFNGKAQEYCVEHGPSHDSARSCRPVSALSSNTGGTRHLCTGDLLEWVSVSKPIDAYARTLLPCKKLTSMMHRGAIVTSSGKQHSPTSSENTLQGLANNTALGITKKAELTH